MCCHSDMTIRFLFANHWFKDSHMVQFWLMGPESVKISWNLLEKVCFQIREKHVRRNSRLFFCMLPYIDTGSGTPPLLFLPAEEKTRNIIKN